MPKVLQLGAALRRTGDGKNGRTVFFERWFEAGVQKQKYVDEERLKAEVACMDAITEERRAKKSKPSGKD